MLEALARADGVWRERIIAAGAGVFEPQSHRPPVCVLTDGLVKLYYPVANGEEWTKSYIAGQGVFGPSAPDEAVVQYGARALEHSTVGLVDAPWVGRVLGANTALAAALAAFQAWLFERKRQREEDLLCLAAEDRYLAFSARDPALAARLELQEVAAYLRITPVALSRIRGRLRQQGRLPARAG